MKTTQFIATALTAAVLGTTGISIAGATTGTTNSPVPSTVGSTVASTTTTTTPAGNHSARHKRLRALVRLRAIRVAAAKIGITPATLRESLRDGHTIAEVATAHHVAPQSVIDALVAAGRARIAKALSAGRVTATQASKLNAQLPTRASAFVNSWLPQRHH
jgi:hypothetical protein